MSTTTYLPKIEGLERKWFVIDAKDVVLGKLATRAASILAGKTKPIYTPFLDTGDHVVVINAEKVHLTGRKEEDKFYHRHSGYPGGIKSTAAGDVRKNYIMIGATWTIDGKRPAGSNEVGTNTLANSTMETFKQNINCFGCHTGPASDPNVMLGDANGGGLSHIWGKINPLFK